MTSGDNKQSRNSAEAGASHDLRHERDQLLSTLTSSPKLSDELARHHEQVLERLRSLEEENAVLRKRVEANDAIRELVERIQSLEEEKEELVSRTQVAEATSWEFGQRFQQFEEEFANMANLFVAANQLHSSLSPRSVMRRIKDVLAQLVGAECYAVYLANAERTELVPIASEGLHADDLGPIRVTSGRHQQVLESGVMDVAEQHDPSCGSLEEPAALVPLNIDERVVGVAIIYRTLTQKQRFDTVDFELLKLLSQQAATALVSASLFASADRRIPGLEAFMDLSV